jgi:hypothetical protein
MSTKPSEVVRRPEMATFSDPATICELIWKLSRRNDAAPDAVAFKVMRYVESGGTEVQSSAAVPEVWIVSVAVLKVRVLDGKLMLSTMPPACIVPVTLAVPLTRMPRQRSKLV